MKKGISGLRRAFYDRDEDYYSGGGDTHDDFDDVGGFPRTLDRDLNAALNLKKLYTVSSTGIHALGDGSSSNESSVSPSLKKESNGKFTYVLKHSVDFCKF